MTDDVDLDEMERRCRAWNQRSDIPLCDGDEVLALIERCRSAEKERDEAKAKNRQTYCAFCSASFPVDDSADEVSKHIATCPKHPMRQVEEDLENANEVMVREHQRYLLMKAERDAFKLECDSLNAALKEGEEAERELRKEVAHDGA